MKTAYQKGFKIYVLAKDNTFACGTHFPCASLAEAASKVIELRNNMFINLPGTAIFAIKDAVIIDLSPEEEEEIHRKFDVPFRPYVYK